jgi:D-lactate dehydrogenase
VLAYDKYPNAQLAGRADVKYVELDELLRQSDIVTLHVPLFAETHYLINADAIRRMKRGAMLINTSRGGLVDTKALIDGLKSGQIGLAGLDVYEEEAGIFFHDISNRVLGDDVLARLLTFNNVVITSHQAFLTQEALANIADTTLASLIEFQSGKRGGELTNAVPLPN